MIFALIVRKYDEVLTLQFIVDWDMHKDKKCSCIIQTHHINVIMLLNDFITICHYLLPAQKNQYAIIVCISALVISAPNGVV